MTILLVALFCAVGLGAFLVWQRRREAPEQETTASKTVAPYHGVAIVPEKNCCSGAMNLRTRRYLAREAPRLPLPNCTAAMCNCRYSHFDDRREGDRRRIHALQRGLRSGSSDQENRGQRDRRRSKAVGFPTNAI